MTGLSWIRKTATALMLGTGLLTAATNAATAQDEKINFVRIGTGSTGGSLFPIGGLIANAISNPPGSRACDKGGSCGVPGMIAVAQSTGGSVDNARAVRAERLDLGLVQADIAYRAYNGSGLFEKEGPADSLRAIAILFPEDLHLVVRKGSGIKDLKDLKGRVVSLGEKGSGTRVDAIAVINAIGILSTQVKDQALKSGQAADKLMAGELDAFFETAVTPSNTVAVLAEKDAIDLLPITGKPIDKMRERFPFVHPGVISAGTYAGQDQAIFTLQVPIVLVARADMPDAIAHGIARAIWHENNAKLFRDGHPGGASMSLKNAALDIGLPLHPGALEYYREAVGTGDTAPKPE